MNKIELKQKKHMSASKGSFELKINDIKVDIISYDIHSRDAGVGPLEITFKMYADPKNSVIDIRPADDSIRD